MKIHYAFFLSIGLVPLFACAPLGVITPTAAPVYGSSSTPIVASINPPVTPSSLDGLPNPQLTPGATNPNVTQANIQSTICTSGFTATIRPPVSYTDSLKITQLQQYGYADQNPKDYEEDHLVPLEVGGNPTDPKNLWPEPHYGTYTSALKDELENKLHKMVCDGQLDLVTAQQAFGTNWVDAYHHWVSSTP
jgi:hypothetical protein